MSFTGTEDHDFPLSTASEWTANYRSAYPGETKGHYFSKAGIEKLLDQTNCVGIRIYYALDDDGAKQLIIVGVKSNEDDMEDGYLAERSFKCPPDCGTANSLNSSV